MNATCFIFGLCFIGAGLLFMGGKLHGYITAWKMMPQEEKDNIRIEELCVNVGGMIALCGLIFLLAGMNSLFKEKCFVWAMIGWIVLSGVDVYAIEKKGKYYRS